MIDWIAVGDACRWVDVGLALLMCVTCAACIVFAADIAQRHRFSTLLGYGVITVGGQFNALGRPPTWVTFLLLVVTINAVATTAWYAAGRLRTVLAPTRGRPGRT